MKWKATDYEATQGPLRYSVYPMHDERGWAFGVEFIPTGNMIFSKYGFKSRLEAQAAAEKMAAGEERHD